MHSIQGIVRQPDGIPLPNIFVSDGTHISKTDDNGLFTLPKHEEQYFIFITVPSTHHFPTDTFGRPQFYVRTPFPDMIVFELLPYEELPAVSNCLYVTDLHLGRGNGYHRFENEVIPSIKQHNPDFIVIGGDLTLQEGIKDEFLTLQSQFDCPVFHVIGNHEMMTDRLDPKLLFKNMFGPTYYSFEHGTAHYIVLDSCTLAPWRKGWQNVVGFIDDRQMKWLEQDLATTDVNKTIIVFIHIPVASHYSERRGIDPKEEPAWELINDAAVIELFAKYKVRFVIQGHMHENEHIRIRGVEYIETGAISGAWWNGPNLDQSPLGFRVIQTSKYEASTEYYDMATNRKVTFQAEAAPTPYRESIFVKVNVFDGDPQVCKVCARLSGVSVWTELRSLPLVKHPHLWDGELPSTIGIVSGRVEVRVETPDGTFESVIPVGSAPLSLYS